MKTIAELQQIIGKKVDEFCEENGESSIYQPINYIMQLGGKRFRPVLSLMSANLFTDELEDALYPALAVEVFHNFTLMHDDIMDKAPLRRGKPTVHERWNSSAAILSGDAMLIQSYQLLMKTNPSLLPLVMNTFNQTALEVCEGQQLDMEFEIRGDVSLEEYDEMIRLKTSVLLAGAMKIGAIVGGASLESQQKIYEFAIHLGMSFQLWDDYLDAFGDERLTGKQRGGDILSDKKTFMFLRAYEKAGTEELAILKKHISAKETNHQEKVADTLKVYHLLGVDVELKEKVLSYHAMAVKILDTIAIESERKEILYAFTNSILERKN